MEGSITIGELKKILTPRINLIDIRSNTAYKLGHIPYAKNISKNELMFNTSSYLKKIFHITFIVQKVCKVEV